jgi:hypothetical protein
MLPCDLKTANVARFAVRFDWMKLPFVVADDTIIKGSGNEAFTRLNFCRTSMSRPRPRRFCDWKLAVLIGRSAQDGNVACAIDVIVQKRFKHLR